MSASTLGDGMHFGQRLRAAREAKGFTLQQIAQATKIAHAHLEALERGNPACVPGGIFARSFVRSYAAQVGLPSQDLVQQFLREFPDFRPSAAVPADQLASWHLVPEQSRTALSAAALVGGVLLLVVASYAVHERWSRREPEPTQIAALSAPVAHRGLDTHAGEQPSSDGGDASRTAPLRAIDARPASRDIDGAAAASTQPALFTAASTASAVSAGNADVGSDALRLAIHPKASCWVRVTANGRVKLARLMRSGDRETLDISDPMVLEVGDAGAFDFSVNGTPGRPLGGSGEVVRTSITRENLAAFLAR